MKRGCIALVFFFKNANSSFTCPVAFSGSAMCSNLADIPECC
jgi:hypothetical protein